MSWRRPRKQRKHERSSGAIENAILQSRCADVGRRRNVSDSRWRLWCLSRLPSAFDENGGASFRLSKGPLYTKPSKDDSCARARVAAILGSCSYVLQSVKSGCRCHFVFTDTVVGKPPAIVLPFSIDYLLAWSRTFRCADTFA